MQRKNLLLVLVGAVFVIVFQRYIKNHESTAVGIFSSVADKSTEKKADIQLASLASDVISNGRRNAIVMAVEKAAPAVVSITVKGSALVQTNPYQDPFFDFFGPRYRKKEFSSMGSGVLISADGYILTNGHVIGSPEDGGKIEQLQVTLADGRHFPAKIIGADYANDLAVIKISGDKFPMAQIQDKPDNLIGEWAMAIGNPYGYLIGDSKPTVTVGVISAVGRTFSHSSGIHYQNMIQTDASINPGNSGGALVNAEGEVIGINTFIFTGGGQAQGSIGLGFAIPIQKAKQVVDELIKYGYIREFTTGIYTDPSLSDALTEGIVVTGLDKGSPGEKAGLQAGDIITSVAGKKIYNFSDIQEIFKLFQVGDAVEIIFTRGHDKLKAQMVLEELKKKRKIF